MGERKMYYVIEYHYAGQNWEQHLNDDRIEIRNCPARTNRSHAIRINGWCGTTNDWAVYAHGEYETVEAARSAIEDIFGSVRECDNYDSPHGYDPLVIETYKPGAYDQMTSDETIDWSCDAIADDVTGKTTNDEIVALIESYEETANDNGYTLASDELGCYIMKFRDLLAEEGKEEVARY